MTYHVIANLAQDIAFMQRVVACVYEQSATFKDDAKLDIVALAKDCLKGNKVELDTFMWTTASAPGVADAANDGDDRTAISTNVTDEQIVSAVQANYPVIASLYFDSKGVRIPLS